jgi:hypothetical protein
MQQEPSTLSFMQWEGGGGSNAISTAQINIQVLSAISQNTALIKVILNSCILFNNKAVNQS